MSAPPAPFTKLSPVDRVFNRIFGALVALGIGFAHNWQLEVRGRRSGRLYSTPVDVVTHGGRRYLVAPRGETQWVRNARASGEVTLRKGRRRATYRLRSLSDAEKPPILKAYLDAFRTTVKGFFPVPAGSPESAFVPLAGRYPAFELLPASTTGTDVG